MTFIMLTKCPTSCTKDIKFLVHIINHIYWKRLVWTKLHFTKKVVRAPG